VKTIVVAGENVELHADRVVYWPRQSTLMVADLHWGKDAAFRAAAIPIPLGSIDRDLQRLTRLLEITGAEQLVLLGDLWHARQGKSRDLLDTVARWRTDHAQLEIVMVRGNHDRAAGDPPAEFCFDCQNEPVCQGPFAFRHYPEATPNHYTWAGHIHPDYELVGPGRDRLRLPCFHLTPTVGILPAFGSFTGGSGVHAQRGDRIYVIVEAEVMAIPIPS